MTKPPKAKTRALAVTTPSREMATVAQRDKRRLATEAKKARELVEEKAQKKDRAGLMVGLTLAPQCNAAGIAKSFSIHGDLDYLTLAEQVGDHCKELQTGNMAQLEIMLMSQAYSLDVMFTSLARRGKIQDELIQYEAHMKLALKAQSQCRATLETLAAIKNPPVVFAKQANIAHGPQQVNNGTAAPVAHAEQNAKPPIELLEHHHGKRLDTRTASAAGGGRQTVEAVGEVHRSLQRRGKDPVKP
jgi:hypothetical protein